MANVIEFQFPLPVQLSLRQRHADPCHSRTYVETGAEYLEVENTTPTTNQRTQENDGDSQDNILG